MTEAIQAPQETSTTSDQPGQSADSVNQAFENRRRETDDGLRQAAERAYEKSVARQEREAPAAMPAGMKATDGDLGTAVERASDWLAKPVAERKQMAAIADDIQQRKEEAERFGLTLEQREAILAGERAKAATEAATEYQPVAETVSKIYPDHKPVEVFQRYAEIDGYMKRDPEGGLRWVAKELGVEHLLAQPMPQPATDDIATITAQFKSQTPDFNEYLRPMTQAIQDGTIPRSGNWMADLQAAYRHVKGRGAKPSREKQATAKSGRPAWEATLERVGREVTAR